MTDTLDPTALINELSAEFDEMAVERHNFGRQKYGELTWLEKDIMQEAMYELLDMANYARYQYIKLRMLQMAIAEDPRLEKLEDADGNITIGVGSFKGGTP